MVYDGYNTKNSKHRKYICTFDKIPIPVLNGTGEFYILGASP